MITPLPYRYAHIADADVRAALYSRLLDEGLADYAMSARQLDADGWLELTMPAPGNILHWHRLIASGHYHGTALFTQRGTACGRLILPAFALGSIVRLGRRVEPFAWIFEQANASCIYGVTPALFRHAWGLAEACGFKIVTRLPGACWLARKQRFVEGVMVMCTRKPCVQRRKQELNHGIWRRRYARHAGSCTSTQGRSYQARYRGGHRCAPKPRKTRPQRRRGLTPPS